MNIFCRQFKSPLFNSIYFVLCRILKATHPARKTVSKSWWNESSCFRKRIHLNQMPSNWASQVRNFLSIVFILTTPLETKHSAWSLWSSSHSAPKFIFGGIWSPTASLFNFGSSQNLSEWFSFIESKNYSFLECKNIFLWTLLEKHILSPLFFLIKRKKNLLALGKYSKWNI